MITIRTFITTNKQTSMTNFLRMELLAKLASKGLEIPHCSTCQQAIQGEKPFDWTLHEDPCSDMEFKIFFCKKECANKYYSWLEDQVFGQEDEEHIDLIDHCECCGETFGHGRTRHPEMPNLCQEDCT